MTEKLEPCDHKNALKGAWTVMEWHCPDCKATIDFGDSSVLRVETYPDGRVVRVPYDNTRPTPAAPEDVVEALQQAEAWLRECANWMAANDIDMCCPMGVAPQDVADGVQKARAAYAAAEEAWTRQVVEWLYRTEFGDDAIDAASVVLADAIERREHLKENG